MYGIAASAVSFYWLFAWDNNRICRICKSSRHPCHLVVTSFRSGSVQLDEPAGGSICLWHELTDYGGLIYRVGRLCLDLLPALKHTFYPDQKSLRNRECTAPGCNQPAACIRDMPNH